jgi:hypothetical protein
MTTKHVVVDGSNIATEGRSTPSLRQLDDAVRAFVAEYPAYKTVTVVVDATFGHRIDAKERALYEEAVSAGEMITPPAGAIGRGDAFVLQIADKANADVFSNDSFQEFHGRYPWLFEEGRLIGGKPVAGVGWVFVLRAPVRGPTSRRSVRDARQPSKKAAAPTKASKPERSSAKPKATKPAMSTTIGPQATGARKAQSPDADKRSGRRRSGTTVPPLNEPMPYAAFVIDHPLGTQVSGIVDRFSSHGAYVRMGDAQGYVPLKALGDPPPRSAREVFTLGETRDFVVHRFDPQRRGIDVVPAGARPALTEGDSRIVAEAVAPAAGNQTTDAEEAPVSPVAKKATRKAAAKRSTKKAPAKRAAKKSSAKKAPAKRTAKKAAKKSTAKKAAKKSTAKKAAKKRAPAKKAAKRTVKKAAKKTTARKATKKRAPAKKAAKRTAKKATKKAAKKSTAKRATKKRAPAKKAAKRTARKAAKRPARKAAKRR